MESMKHSSIISLSNEESIISNELKITACKYNIHYAFKPLFQLQSLFAMQRTAVNSWRNNLHCAVMAALLIVLSGFGLKERLKMFKNYQPGLTIIENLMLIIHLLTSLGNICVSAFHSKSDYAIFIARTIDVATVLGHNVPATYKIFRTVVINMIASVLLILFILFAFDTYAFSFIYNNCQILLSTFDNLFYLMNSLVFIHFVLSMYYARSAFFIINIILVSKYENKTSVMIKELQCYNNKNPFKYLYPWSIIAKATVGRCTKTKYDIDKLMEAYMANCDHCDFINNFFNVQNLLITVNGIISVIRSLFDATSYGMQNDNLYVLAIVSGCLFALYDILTLVFMTAACEMVVAEAKRTSRILDSLVSAKINGDTDRIFMWSHLVARRYPHFTACKLFTIDYTLLSSMAATVTAYLIILMQMTK